MNWCAHAGRKAYDAFTAVRGYAILLTPVKKIKKMKVFAHKNHRGNVEVNSMETNQPGEIPMEVVATEKPITIGNVQSTPTPGEVIAVNGVMHNCEVVA